MAKKNRRSKDDLRAENEELWQKLESLYDLLGDMFDGDSGDEEDDPDE